MFINLGSTLRLSMIFAKKAFSQLRRGHESFLFSAWWYASRKWLGTADLDKKAIMLVFFSQFHSDYHLTHKNIAVLVIFDMVISFLFSKQKYV